MYLLTVNREGKNAQGNSLHLPSALGQPQAKHWSVKAVLSKLCFHLSPASNSQERSGLCPSPWMVGPHVGPERLIQMLPPESNPSFPTQRPTVLLVPMWATVGSNYLPSPPNTPTISFIWKRQCLLTHFNHALFSIIPSNVIEILFLLFPVSSSFTSEFT